VEKIANPIMRELYQGQKPGGAGGGAGGDEGGEDYDFDDGEL